MQDPARILIIRPSALGDVCRTVPVLASLRRAYPKATIDWVVQDDFAPAIAAHPSLDEIIKFPRLRMANWWRGPSRLSDALKWFKDLRDRRYELVFDCQGLGRSGLMTWVTGAPKRVGLRAAREFAWLAYNVRVETRATHTVDQMLALVESIGVPPVRDLRLHVEPEHSQWWRVEQERRGILGASYAVLAPTSRWPSKRWPIERFAQMLEPLRRRGFRHFMIIGSPTEAQQVQPLFETESVAEMLRAGQVIDLVGQTGIGQTMAVIAGARFVIANDSAPLHMAVGFNRPCIGLYGPTDPAVVGPYQTENAVIRGYAAGPGEIINFKDLSLGDRHMRFISTAAVLQQVDRVLAHWDGESASDGLDQTPQVAEGASS